MLRARPVTLGVLGAVVLVVVAVLALAGSEYRVAGDSDPGRLTSICVALLRLAATSGAAVCVGSLVFAVFCTVPRDGRIDVDGYAATLVASRAARVWASAAFLLVPVTAVDSAGQPLGALRRADVLTTLFSAEDLPKGWLVAALLATVVAVALRFVLSWAGLLGLIVVAIGALLSPVLAGNATQNTAHDITTNAVVLHVVAASVYLGALLALIAHIRRGGGHLALAHRRYRVVAAVCWVVVVLTGIVLSVVLLPPGQLFTSNYGVLLVLTLVLTVGLATARLRRPHRATSILGWAGLDLVLLFLALGAAGAMARQPAPAFYVRPAGVQEVLLGYELPGGPNLVRLLTLWRPDLLLGAAGVVLGGLYLAGARRVVWSGWRTVSWMGGCVLLVVITSSGVTAYAHATFSMHMVQHMALSMVVPPLLVLGAPVTLAARTLRASSVPGPREWILAVAHSPLVRVLTQPVVAVIGYTAVLYGVYLTGVYEVVAQYHWAHQLASLALLGTGYAFFWAVFGPDDGPSKAPHLGRLGMLVALMPINAVFGVIVLSTDRIIGDTFYRSLALPWVDSLADEQRVGALVGWLGGEVPMVVAAVILLVQWARNDDDAAAVPVRSDDYQDMIDALARGRR